eukprot:m.433434 g.433434  ORF g.433434 m.433434 type:complete len:56 (+) comp20248_c5_seq2:1063-1230(+)
MSVVLLYTVNSLLLFIGSIWLGIGGCIWRTVLDRVPFPTQHGLVHQWTVCKRTCA